MHDMIERITPSRIKYHRNGVGGAGFFLVEFAWVDDEGCTRNMLATVFQADEGEQPDYYAVIDADDPSLRWRGDHFIHALWKVIKDQPSQDGAAGDFALHI